MTKATHEMRQEYERSDFSKLEPGKFSVEVAKGTAVALLDPEVAKAFPSSAAVNEARHGLLETAEQASRITSPSTGRRIKRRDATR